MNRETIRETMHYRLFIANAHAFLQSKVQGCRPQTVMIRRKGGDFNYLRGLSDGEFEASACLEFGCGLYE